MSKKSVDLKAMLAAAQPETRLGLIKNALDLYIRTTLEIQSDVSLDHNSPFTELGMDSISAVKLRQLLNDSLGGTVEIKSTDIFDHSTVTKLAEHILKQMK